MEHPPKSFQPSSDLEQLVLTVTGAKPSGPHLVKVWQLVAIGGAVATGLGLLALGFKTFPLVLIACVAAIIRYRLWAMETGRFDIDERMQTRLTMAPTGLTISGPDGTTHYPPHRVEDAKVERVNGRMSIAVRIAYPPNLVLINAHVHADGDLRWLAKELTTRFDDGGGEGMAAAEKALNSLRNRSS